MPELLNSTSIPLSSIDSIIWSHHHVDHKGDVSLFPPSTSLVVGPGFKTNPSTYSGFPLNPNSHVSHSNFAGRDVIELDFSSTTGVLKFAGLRGIDWFDDGSLYLLEAPGHAPEYIMVLAHTSADKFVLLAGDIASHPGVIRPSPLRLLPESIPWSNSSSRTKPFFELTSYIIPDPVAGRTTLDALQTFDANEHASSFLITIRPYASLVTLSHSRVGRSRVASMVVLGSTIIARTPYTGAFWKIFGRASIFSVTNGRTSSVRSVGFATL